jgi:hypothetical protein
MLGNRENPIEDIKNKLTHRYSIIAIIPMTSSNDDRNNGMPSWRWRR